MKRVMLALLVLLSLTTIIAENPIVVELEEGRNVIVVDEYFPAFSVSQLLANNPSITAVSMREYGQTYGFIRAFGGVGTDFLIYPEKEFEIYSAEPLTLYLYG